MSKEHEQQPRALTFKEVKSAATEQLLAEGNHPPTLIVEGERDLIGFRLEVPSTADARAEQMYVVGITIARSDIVGNLRQVFHVSEAWMSSSSENESAPKMVPSEDPKRREILIVSNAHLHENTFQLALIEMLRSEDGTLRELRDITSEIGPGAGSQSPLLSAFLDGYTQGRASMTGFTTQSQ